MCCWRIPVWMICFIATQTRTKRLRQQHTPFPLGGGHPASEPPVALSDMYCVSPRGHKAPVEALNFSLTLDNSWLGLKLHWCAPLALLYHGQAAKSPLRGLAEDAPTLGHPEGECFRDVSVPSFVDAAALYLHSGGAIAPWALPSSPLRVKVVHAGLQQDLQDARGRLHLPEAAGDSGMGRMGQRHAWRRPGRTPAATSLPSALHTPCAPCSGARGTPT